MSSYVVRRVLYTVPVLLGISLAVFLMLHLLPVDPVQFMLTHSSSGTAPSVTVSAKMMAQLRHELGLDRPLVVQYLSFVWKAVHGDLGQSFRSQQPVSTLLMSQFPYTVRLALAGMSCAIVLGLGLGIAAGVWVGSWVDRISMIIASIGISAPSFWMGLMLIYFLALTLRLFPTLGTGSPSAIVLPALTLGLPGAAIIARLTRSNLAAIWHDDFIVTARAKGLPERMVLARHALRNAMLPVLTVVGLQFGDLMTGTVIVETVFGRPGIGRMGVDAILQADYPLVQGFVLLVATVYVLVNLAVDLAYGWLDPRIHYA
jgi:ABC-type dipeptide/oligopeptide/nickel transport system permease component